MFNSYVYFYFLLRLIPLFAPREQPNSGEPVAPIDQPAPAVVLHGSGGTVAAFSEDGKILLTAGEGAARVWDAKSFQPRTAPLLHPGKINAAAISSDGHKVLTAGEDRTVRIWDAETGAVIRVFKHGGPVLSAAFSPDGTHVISGSKDNTAQIWETTPGGPIVTMRFKYEAFQVTFSPGGDKVSILSGSAISLFDAKTGQSATSPDREWMEVCFHVTFSPDGKQLVSAGETSATVVDVATEKIIAAAHVWPQDSPWRVFTAAYTRDGSKLVTGTTGLVQVWNSATCRPLTKELKGDDLDYFETVGFSRDGKRVFAGGDSADYTNVWAVWDSKSGKSVQAVRYGHSAQGYALSPDGTLVAGGGLKLGDTGIWKLPADDK